MVPVQSGHRVSGTPCHLSKALVSLGSVHISEIYSAQCHSSKWIRWTWSQWLILTHGFCFALGLGVNFDLDSVRDFEIWGSCEDCNWYDLPESMPVPSALIHLDAIVLGHKPPTTWSAAAVSLSLTHQDHMLPDLSAQWSWHKYRKVLSRMPRHYASLTPFYGTILMWEENYSMPKYHFH